MAFQDHKKGMVRAFFVVLILAILSFAVFSCSALLRQQGSAYVNLDDATLVQLDEPEADAPAMCVKTTEGNIVAELYPEQAPAYVKQFTELAESGYYDNTYVFSIQDGIYFEAGTPNEDGTMDVNDEEQYEHVEQETSADLWPFRGAFCAPGVSQEGNFWDRLTNQMTTYCGTRFLVCNTIEFDDDAKEQLDAVAEDAEEVNAAFLERGGVPNYSQQMTIFAQAYGEESFDVIDTITAAVTKDAAGEEGYTAPEEEIRILTIEIGTYGEFSNENS